MGNIRDIPPDLHDASSDPAAMIEEIATRRARQNAVARLIAPHRGALQAALHGSAQGRRAIEDAQRLCELTRTSNEALRDGLLSRAQAVALLQSQQEAYRNRHGDFLSELRARHTGSEPSLADLASTALGTEGAWVVTGDAHGAAVFMLLRPNGGGDEGGEPAPSPPPPVPPAIDITRTAPYDLPPRTDVWANGVTTWPPTASATAADGRCNVDACAFAAIASGGGSVCRSLVGTAVDIPMSHSRLQVTADIQIDGSVWAMAVLLAVAGAGLDFWLRIDLGDGSAPREQNLVVAQVIAPVLWFAEWKSTVQTRIVGTVDLDPALSYRVQAYAGINGHAEAGGVDGGSFALGFGRVASIRVLAT